MAKHEDYNWLDDPFNEKKAARDQEQASTSGGTKLALGCGCLLAVVGVVALILFAVAGIADVLA